MIAERTVLLRMLRIITAANVHAHAKYDPLGVLKSVMEDALFPEASHILPVEPAGDFHAKLRALGRTQITNHARENPAAGVIFLDPAQGRSWGIAFALHGGGIESVFADDAWPNAANYTDPEDCVDRALTPAEPL